MLLHLLCWMLLRSLEDEDFSLVSHFSKGIINETSWYVDIGASKHMISSYDFFEPLTKWDSKLHIVGGDKTQKLIRG